MKTAKEMKFIADSSRSELTCVFNQIESVAKFNAYSTFFPKMSKEVMEVLVHLGYEVTYDLWFLESEQREQDCIKVGWN